MNNKTQLSRYKRLLDYIDQKFKEDINIEKVEDISFYSYRNINRIFLALHHETIGKYIKRRRLEKAAEYLKYSDVNISEIAIELGFSDIAAFSKAFKVMYNCSPSAFRRSSEFIQKINRQTISSDEQGRLIHGNQLEFEVEVLPEIHCLYLQHKGSYENIEAIKSTWEQIGQYAYKKGLLSETSIFMAEILDDNEISDSVNCRYNACILLENPLVFEPEGLFKTKTSPSQKYVKFLHKGSHESTFDTYNMIYAYWMTEVQMEFADLPVLEFYLNDEKQTPSHELMTEIYIPVVER